MLDEDHSPEMTHKCNAVCSQPILGERSDKRWKENPEDSPNIAHLTEKLYPWGISPIDLSTIP